MVCVFGIGDCGAKATTSLNVDLSTTVSQVSKTLTSVSQSSTTSVVNANSFKLVVGGNIKNSTIKNEQKIASNVKISTSLTAQAKSQMTQDIQSTMKAAVDQATSTQTGFLSTAQSSSQSKTNFNNALNTSLSTENVSKTVQDAFTSVVNKNSSEIYIGGSLEGSYIDNSQDIANQLVAIGIVNQMVENINQQLAKNDFDGKITQSATAKSSGVAELVAAWFQGQAMLVGISSCACILCCFMIIFLVMGLGSTPAGQDAIGKGADLGSMYAMSRFK
jgi:hypothetical protein